MCVLGVLLAVSVTMSDNVNMAEYSTKGIAVNPSICALPVESQLFALYHEEAHHVLNHLKRFKDEGQKTVELEADQYAIDRLKSEGYNACNAVQFVLPVRGFFSFTHPNRFTLEQIACGE
jgi:predicted metal-dependent peptidase